MKALAAALAAAALAGLLSSCTPGFNYLGQGPVGNPPDGPGSTSGQVVSAAPAGRLPPESVPPYFLAFTGPVGPANPVSQQPDVTVRASSTGQVLAVVGPPVNTGTFTFVTASAGDGRTFLVGAQPVGPQGDVSREPVSFYLLRFDPASSRARLTLLPVPAASLDADTPALVSAALSPDGTRLAVAEAEPGRGDVLDVHVYPVPAGGPGQTWKVTGKAASSDVWGARLSWSANDRVLAAGLAYGTVRLLDTAVPPGRAAAVEDITLAVKDGYQCYYPVLMTSDGSKLICGVAADYYYREAGGSEPGRGGFAVYDIRTGDLTDVLGAEGPGQPGVGPWRQTPAVAWASPRGTILIGQPMLGQVSIFSNARYQPIAWTGVQLANPASQPASDGLPGNH